MEPAIRGARTQSELAAAPAEGPELRRTQRSKFHCGAIQLRVQPRPPGTEFLEAETKRQKSSSKRANARRDQNSLIEWPEIPAKTLELASCRKPAVCGDWMVVCAVRYEPVSGWQFPANREFYREFCDSGALRADFVARNRGAAATSWTIPYSN